MNWKWNNLLIFHKQNEQHYWVGLLNILGLFKKKNKNKNRNKKNHPENFFGIFLNRTIHNKQTKKIHPHLFILDLKILLLKSAQLQIWTDFTRANCSIFALEEDHYLSIPLCLCLYCTFTEIYIQGSTSSYYDCSSMCLIQSSCNVFHFRRYYFQTSHFLSNFFGKLEFFHPPTFVLYYLPIF